MQLDPDKLDNIFNINAEERALPSVEEEVIELDKDKVYTELATLIKNGNDVFSTVKMMIEADPEAEMVQGAASMLNAIKDTLREFTKLHIAQMRFEQQKEIEELKIKGRKEINEHKFNKAKELIDNKQSQNQIGFDPTTTTELMPFSQEKIIEAIVNEEKEKKA